ncbi:MAG: acyl-CoA dehydrogenase family protein [Actinomycetota bacterium]
MSDVDADELVEQLLATHDPITTDTVTFRGAQFDLGLAWVHLPEGCGGLGLAPSVQRRVDERLRDAGAPPAGAGLGMGVVLAGPTLAVHAGEALRDRLQRRAFTGEDLWCQLFSEPGSGSDMAGLAARAERDGDEWVVTGQKVWNTNAHLADRGMLIARTDPGLPKHRGITYLALDMHAPGVEVRPLRQITGKAEFSEVYLTDVRIPDADRIGDVGEGWRVAMTTLANERTSIGGGGGGRKGPGAGAIAEVVRILREEAVVPGVVERDRVMQRWIEAETLRLTNARAGANRRAGTPGPEGSIAKLAFGTQNQDVYELCVDLLGAAATVEADYAYRREDHVGYVGAPGSSREMFLRARANSIEGGTTEIQRNIVGERVLGLPGEPRTDRDVPWSDVPRS